MKWPMLVTAVVIARWQAHIDRRTECFNLISVHSTEGGRCIERDEGEAGSGRAGGRGGVKAVDISKSLSMNMWVWDGWVYNKVCINIIWPS